MITFSNVTKKYPDGTVAVDNLSLEVPEGTLTVFVGPSGCGKTTSMRMINRMIDPTSGTLTVDGKEHSLAAGTLAIVPRGAARSVVAAAEGLRCLTVHRRRGGLGLADFRSVRAEKDDRRG